MPHGGYHGVIKMGGRVIQDSSGRPVSSGSSSRPQRRQLKTASEIPDNRERFIANQAQKAANQQAQFLINQANRRSDVETAMRFAPETVNRSDFTGYTGGPFGLRISKDQDTGISKLREGLTSDQYANYMRGLYSINPQRMETMFPFASGATIRNLSRFAPGLGTLQSIAGFVGGKTGDAIQGLKQIAINKGILPPTTLNPNTGTTIDPTKVQNVAELDPSTKALIAPDVYGGRSPIDEAFASLPSTQFGREYMERFGPRQGFTAFNVGGLASINNPEYTMLRRASDFDI
jgi:hypothetical protein